MVDSGRVSLNSVIDDTQLTNLREQVMHILLHCLDPTDPAIIASSTQSQIYPRHINTLAAYYAL